MLDTDRKLEKNLISPLGPGGRVLGGGGREMGKGLALFVFQESNFHPSYIYVRILYIPTCIYFYIHWPIYSFCGVINITS